MADTSRINALSIALVTGVGAVLFAQQRPAPEQAPVFRGGVELVQLVVSVLDDRRQPVRGLAVTDFTLLDNGVTRPIRTFTPVDLPARQPPAGVAWTSDIAPDVATNQVGDQPGRLVVILMDRSIRHHGPTVTARKIATSIVDALGPNDMAALVSTGAGEPQIFTADRARLIRSINQRDWSTGSDEYPWTLEGALGDPRCLCGLCVFDTVARVADAVRETPGRSKSLFFIGSGMVMQAGPRPPTLDPGCDRLTRVGRQKMFDAIALSNLTVHSIDPNGLASTGPQTRASEPGDGRGLPEGVAARLRREAQQAETNEVLATHGTLRVLPDLTGGRTVVNTNAPEDSVPEMFRESESYYVLGFEATPGTRASAPRSIEVKVARRGVRVSTRRQYVPPLTDGTIDAPAGSIAPAARTPPDDPLSGLLPDGAPPLTMALAAFAGSDGANGIVTVSVDASAFVRDTDDPRPLNVSVVAVDQTGQPVASARQISTVPGLRSATGRASGADVPTHLTLPPGDYEVRVALTDAVTNTTASVFSQVVVPAFASERLSLSDIIIERVTGAPPSTAEAGTVAPITQRSFRRSDSVQAIVQVYQATERSDSLQPVSAQVRIIDAKDSPVHDQSLVLEPAQFSTRRTAHSRLTLPVQNLQAGEYLLRVDARMGDRVAGRAMRFTVE